MKLNVFCALRLCALAVLMLSVYFGVLQFELWGQVTSLKGTAVFDIDPTAAHFLRYLVVYPIFWVADLSGLAYDLVFSYVAVVLVFATSALIGFVASLIARRRDLYHRLAFLGLVCMCIVSMFMNGRILFAMLGYAYICANFIRWEYGESGLMGTLVRNLAGHYLTTVSSGTFLVGVLFVLGWLAIKVNRDKPVAVYVLFAGFLSAASPLIWLYLMKNINFYGGGVGGLFNMLNHGAGFVLHKFGTFVAVEVVVVVIAVASVFVWFFGRLVGGIRLLYVGIAAACFGGLFGFSTLMVGLPLVIALVVVRFGYKLKILGGGVSLQPRDAQAVLSQ